MQWLSESEIKRLAELHTAQGSPDGLVGLVNVVQAMLRVKNEGGLQITQADVEHQVIRLRRAADRANQLLMGIALRVVAVCDQEVIKDFAEAGSLLEAALKPTEK